MPLYNVTLKDGASPDELDKAKETAQSKGGVIKHEFSLIKGFTVEYPADAVGALESNDHIHVEQDAEVTTQ
ncbi:MAG: hypothetical protein Q9191_007100 [Dirinaria sp. TL-2023a]